MLKTKRQIAGVLLQAATAMSLSGPVRAEPEKARSGEPAPTRAPRVATEPVSRASERRAPGVQGRVVVDRAVVRFSAAEAGGGETPYFIHERELAFEARLVALRDRAFQGGEEPYRRHHLQAALERHIAEVLLSVLSLDPEPRKDVVNRQRDAAWRMAEEDAGGADVLALAAKAEGLGMLELRRIFHRRARASLYLDQMVAPMLAPSDLELRRAHQSGETPFSGQPYAQVEAALRTYYVSQALRQAAARFFQRARARLKIQYL